MDVMTFTCERCGRKTEMIAVLVGDGKMEHICPVCLANDKVDTRWPQQKAGPREVKADGA